MKFLGGGSMFPSLTVLVTALLVTISEQGWLSSAAFVVVGDDRLSDDTIKTHFLTATPEEQSFVSFVSSSSSSQPGRSSSSMVHKTHQKSQQGQHSGGGRRGGGGGNHHLAPVSGGNHDEQKQQSRHPRRNLKKEKNCTKIDGIVEFEEYILLSVVAIPALVTEDGLREVERKLVQSYNETVSCSNKGNGFRIIEEAEILPDAIDAFGDDYGLVLGLQTDLGTGVVSETDLVPRNFTYLMVVRGQCNACGPDIILFANATSDEEYMSSESGSDKRNRQLLQWSSSSSSSSSHQEVEERKNRNIKSTIRGGGFDSRLRTLNEEELRMKKDMDEDDKTPLSDVVRKGKGSSSSDSMKEDPCMCEGPPLDEFLEIYNDLINTTEVVSTVIGDVPGRRRQLDTSSSSDDETTVDDFVVINIVQLKLVEGCDTQNFTTFNATVVVEVDSELLNSTDFNITELEQSILETYNQANALNGQICDLLFRTVIDVRAAATLAEFSFNRRRTEMDEILSSWSSSSSSSALSALSSSKNDYHQEEQNQLSQVVMEQELRSPAHQDETKQAEEEEEMYNPDSFSSSSTRDLQFAGPPTSAPTVFRFVRNNTFTSITLFLSLRCNQCPAETSLFDDVSVFGRRRLIHDDFEEDIDMFGLMAGAYSQSSRFLELEDTIPTFNTTDCLCAENAIQRGTTSKEFLDILQDISPIPIKSVNQIENVECGEEGVFETTLTGILTIKDDIPPPGAKEALEILAQDAYNDAAARVCDPFSRTIIAATLRTELVVGENLEIVFDVTVRCRGCDGVDALFLDDGFRRRHHHRNMQEKEEENTATAAQCFCLTGAPDRGPTQLEFDEAFESQVGDIIPNVCPPTDPPSVSPSISPSDPPTNFPTKLPSEFPTESPSFAATTDIPSLTPTDSSDCCGISGSCLVLEGYDSFEDCCEQEAAANNLSVERALQCCGKCNADCCFELGDEGGSDCCGDDFPSPSPSPVGEPTLFPLPTGGGGG